VKTTLREVFAPNKLLIPFRTYEILGAVHKRFAVEEDGGLFSADKGEGDSLDADVRTFWCKKLGNFSKFMCVRTDKGRGLSQYGHFSDKGGAWSIFRNLWARLL